jgi:hypothetical protein
MLQSSANAGRLVRSLGWENIEGMSLSMLSVAIMRSLDAIHAPHTVVAHTDELPCTFVVEPQTSEEDAPPPDLNSSSTEPYPNVKAIVHLFSVERGPRTTHTIRVRRTQGYTFGFQAFYSAFRKELSLRLGLHDERELSRYSPMFRGVLIPTLTASLSGLSLPSAPPTLGSSALNLHQPLSGDATPDSAASPTVSSGPTSHEASPPPATQSFAIPPAWQPQMPSVPLWEPRTTPTTVEADSGEPGGGSGGSGGGGGGPLRRRRAPLLTGQRRQAAHEGAQQLLLDEWRRVMHIAPQPPQPPSASPSSARSSGSA